MLGNLAHHPLILDDNFFFFFDKLMINLYFGIRINRSLYIHLGLVNNQVLYNPSHQTQFSQIYFKPPPLFFFFFNKLIFILTYIKLFIYLSILLIKHYFFFNKYRCTNFFYYLITKVVDCKRRCCNITAPSSHKPTIPNFSTKPSLSHKDQITSPL